jgi:NitT/TauT family transport system ATP-binding protein
VSEPPVLRVDRIDMTYQAPGRAPVEALRGISLDFRRGEFAAVVGASGSGKSTLLRIIDGLLAPTAGRIYVDDRPVTRPGRDRAMVFQQDSLLPWRSVIDNVSYGLALAGTARRRGHEHAQKFIELTGLKGFEHHYPHQLSGGMRQRVNVARALAVDPEILLLDEPFAALDAQTREIMQTELLKIWNADRKTVLLITHQIDEAVFLSDRVIVFSARPGTVREEIVVDLPRPRDLAIKRTPEFAALVDRVWRLIEDEVRSSMGLAPHLASR